MPRRGRPRKVMDPLTALAEIAKDVAACTPPPAPPAPDPELRLLPLAGPEMDAHMFGQLTTLWQRRRLIRQGKLRAVRIGRDVYVSEGAIAEFIARGGAR